MCADSLTGNTQNTQQIIQPICPNRPIIRNVFDNSSIVDELVKFIEIFQDMYVFFLSV